MPFIFLLTNFSKKSYPYSGTTSQQERDVTVSGFPLIMLNLRIIAFQMKASLSIVATCTATELHI